eukprot:22916-Chlamydomonas_euryale.AAC.1
MHKKTAPRRQPRAHIHMPIQQFMYNSLSTAETKKPTSNNTNIQPHPDQVETPKPRCHDMAESNGTQLEQTMQSPPKAAIQKIQNHDTRDDQQAYTPTLTLCTHNVNGLSQGWARRHLQK